MAVDDDMEKQEGSRTYIEVKTPFGFSVKFGGRELFSIIIMMLSVGFVGFFIYKHDAQAQVQALNITNALQENKDTVRKVLGENKETTEALIYMMTLSDTEKRSLLLRKPKRLMELEHGDWNDSR